MVPTAELRVSLLGEPRAWRGDSPLKLGNGLQAAAFVALALRANRVVTRSELVTDLWGDTRPTGASSRIYTYISALRRILDGGGRGAEEVLESGYSGYRLSIASDDLDFALLQRYRDNARVSRAAGDLGGELSSLDLALGMWHGEALGGVPGPLALSWRGRLDEVKLALSARRASLMIDLGRPDEVVDELKALAALYPVREDIHHSLMLALFRSGRRLEALEVYREARDVLVDRFGTEPGAALRALRQEVLSGSAPAATVPGPAGVAALADHGLSGDVRLRIANARPASFVGRAGELARIRTALAGVRAGRGGSLWVNGAPGTGKTALLGEGLADAVGGECVIGWAVADEMSHQVPLGVLEECVGNLDSAFRAHVGQSGPDLVAEGAATRADTRLRLGGVIARVRALLECAGGRPLVLVVDDLHWADDETLLVWRHLHTMTRRHPLLLVTSCRPLPRRRNLDLLRMLVTESGCDTFELGELSDTEVRDLLRSAHTADRRANHAVVTMSGGNPAFVHAIAAQAAVAPQVRSWPATPDPVVEVVRDHLDCLSGGTRDMLRQASLLGVSHSVGELLRASGKRAHDLLNFVDEALAGGVLVDLGGSRLRFRHPVVRRVLYESVPVALRRAALHEVGVVDTTALSTYWSRPVETHTSAHEDVGDRLVPSSRSLPRYRP
ncbi:BTAD domain-containing putative transcriptional regulator [Umezawaea tangerina]|uniref:DNA-binding SARP family transcriptional activator n=1 Tax=Umezawaea tangerina TaxID=84725 RepID=A0A2T0T0A4_9PSEU|nr:BTAD domain-containing putative transcriptional regulator [Umezawaea tangerina]PRY39105.1 DNA-binding SARP family transcriptional activator [Umezawaea tangerina]